VPDITTEQYRALMECREWIAECKRRVVARLQSEGLDITEDELLFAMKRDVKLSD
jgi:hypothetical protein